MSVTGHMYNINAAKKLGELEIEQGLEGHRSWHHQFRNSAYIFVGGLHQGLTEGDVVIVFSQFGEIVDVNVVRDRGTGKSKGFAFICYEDQRSTIIAVDNMNGSQLLNRTIRVDHVDKYKAPKQFDENDLDENGDPKLLEYKATGAEGAGHEVYNVVNSQKKMDEINSKRKAQPKRSGLEDEDEAWAKAFEDGLKTLEDSTGASGGRSGGVKKIDKKKLKKDLKEIKKMQKEAKLLKLEAKKAKEEAKRKKKDKGKKAKKEVSESSPDSDKESDDDSEASSDSDSSGEPRKKKGR